MKFDPFNDRTSRNVRNGMSSALAEAIKKRSPKIYKSFARSWLETLKSGEIADFIEDRLRRYDLAYSRIEGLGDRGLFDSSVILWNSGLFFEFHECLEEIWQDSSGQLREALKGLIQAAGFYIHLERGRTETARKLGAKAARLISQNRQSLHYIKNLDDLICRLENGIFEPVCLEADF